MRENDFIKSFATALEVIEKEQVKKLEKEYEKALKELKALLLDLVGLYNFSPEAPIPYGNLLVSQLRKKILKAFGSLTESELRLIKQGLKKIGKDCSDTFNELLESEVKVSDYQLNNAVNEPVEGLTYEDRMTSNFALLLLGVQAVLVDGLTKGKEIKVISKEIEGKIGQGLNRVKRIVRTEAVRVWTNVSLFVMGKVGIKKVKFVAVLDDRTSKTCKEHNGQIYEIDKIKAKPPLHPNCRSILVPYTEE